MQDYTKERIANLINWVANSVIECTDDRLSELSQEGKTVDTGTVKESIQYAIEVIILEQNHYHFTEALELAVNDRIDVDDLVNQYANNEEGETE